MPDVHGALWADLIGKPFAWGGRGPEGYDCYGLVREMLRRTGQPLPAQDTPAEITAVAAVVDGELARGRWVAGPKQAGAMVLFRMPLVIDGQRTRALTHCGFLLSDFEFIHAWKETGGVTVERMHDWERRAAGFYTFSPDAP